MKITLKIAALLMLFAFVGEAQAQTFGVKVGANFANQLWKDNDDTYSDDFKMNLGINGGITAEFPINDMIAFETGLMLNSKGFKIEETEDILGTTFTLTTKTNLLYLDIPLNLKAGIDMGGAKLYGTFGPYVGFGITGKVKMKLEGGGETEEDSEDIEWGSDDDSDLKRLDFGLNIGAGVEFGAISVGVNYGLGLGNLLPNPEDGAKINNRVIGISLGYKFGN